MGRATWRASMMAAGAALFMVACQPAPSGVTGPPPQPAAQPESPPVTTPPTSVVPPATLAVPSLQPPPSPIYVCDVASVRSPVEFAGKVEALCRQNPEMGPCKYERDACRRRGGRVYTANGDEVTATVEAEYDRKVRRVTLQADGAPAKK